ncbi:fumarate reductase/succinate dehydrogenase flavoprotein domain protein [Methylobacterium sp. 4-46]|uniref:FAD-dependent tricarballylate dehydrogenase TcuA n=1 Tax=unclassified Methylobacterium TaxID=2615210 RepID=UPI000152E3ED|nr:MULTISPECIES: FAD-dependent tricarballylate dehydrogenase TcuA [Methylobacterium]ACA17239.1 fumarate reductase/succinate dehydrogenase flavoprotein domain protein [Methylobacterium sp. 4-46]WFT82922.1 FAD-dependent tricarballylate dehydrogenase TcuA [Methylobacterium nodulans]
MQTEWDIIVVGSGNAAMSAAIAAREQGRRVLIIEKAGPDLAGGNTAYTAGAMRFVYEGKNDLLPLLEDPHDPRLARTEFGAYTAERFAADLLGFNDGRPLSREQQTLIAESYDAVRWLASKGVKFEPIYARQSYEKDGRFVFWGGLTLATRDEGLGLVQAERAAFKALGGEIRFGCAAEDLIVEDGRVCGVRTHAAAGEAGTIRARAVILGCGGFESNPELRAELIGPGWEDAKVRGTPHNRGDGLAMAFRLGARRHGFYGGCHATPMDLYTPPYGNLALPHLERKHYRKICYFLGVMINAEGRRFVDEGRDFRNYTYAQFGRAIMEQPKHIAWQIFDSKVDSLLYSEYRFHDAHYVESDTLDRLIDKLDGLNNKEQARATLAAFNAAVDESVQFNPTAKDGRGTKGLDLPKSNWAQTLDTPPFKAYPVTGGITFTYGGLEVDEAGAVIAENGAPIPGLYACGEIVGGVFFNGYPGGSGLTSGVVFGRRAGAGAAAQTGRGAP